MQKAVPLLDHTMDIGYRTSSESTSVFCVPVMMAITALHWAGAHMFQCINMHTLAQLEVIKSGH